MAEADSSKRADASSTEAAPQPAPQRITFYRRPLPPDLIAFSSPEGRALFREALADGGMEAFFPLSEHFHTQSEPAYCGLGSLSMALNALGIDPGRAWKGPWRWFSEELLDCCAPLEIVQKEGIPLAKLHCLARCNGAQSRMAFGNAVSLDAFREDVIHVTHASADAESPEILVVGYSRRALGQTGDGHFSPIGGYHKGRDLVLLMDVARFKYPPHWCPLTRVWEAMQTIDPASGRSRGYLLLKRSSAAATTAGAAGGPSLLLSLDKTLYAEWPELRNWLIGLHLQHAQSGIVNDAAGAAATPFLQEEEEAEGFKRFLTALPPTLATLITPLPAAGAALAGIDGGNGGDGTSPRAALRRLVAAIEAHPLFPLLTPEALAPFKRRRSDSGVGGGGGGGGGGCGEGEAGAGGDCCCTEFKHVRDGGHSMLVLYLALREWAQGSGGATAPMQGDGLDEGQRLLNHEVRQLHIKLQAIVGEMVGRLPAEGLQAP